MLTEDEVRDCLIGLFPDFAHSWNRDDNLVMEDDGSYSYHGLFTEFCWYFKRDFRTFDNDQLRRLFGVLEAWEVTEDADFGRDRRQWLSNAVFTCFLEDIAAEGFTSRITPFMGPRSLEYYRYWDH